MGAQLLETSYIAVPFLDLSHSHAPLKEQLLTDIGELFDTGAFTNGPVVSDFERAFASYCGTQYCVGMSSGLDALRIGLLASELEPGEEVVVPAMTFVATLEAVTQAGGVPVVVDISDDDYCIDTTAAGEAIGARTHSVMPVHLYGQMADMRTLRDLVTDRGVTLIEDACQAHGAERDGLSAGATGDAAAFSFYPGKNLGAAGDAGALVTSDATITERAQALREHGQTAKYVHTHEGFTARLDSLQALVLSHKLPLLAAWNEQRRDAARTYASGLDAVGDLKLPSVADGSAPVWHLYVVRTAEPERLASFLQERGIATGRHYPDPVHLSPAYAWLGHRAGDFPVAEALAREGLSLPIFPGITAAQLGAVLEGIRAFFDG
jgi:dTDP-4-amino-4,6-dideoxygalactose transaminase